MKKAHQIAFLLIVDNDFLSIGCPSTELHFFGLVTPKRLISFVKRPTNMMLENQRPSGVARQKNVGASMSRKSKTTDGPSVEFSCSPCTGKLHHVKKASTSAAVHDSTTRAGAGTGAGASVTAPGVVGLVLGPAH